ncbi:MAG: multidrug DMT transporter permease [Rhodoluna sp.]|nr:multidrug DMT transporter permease [Rhodoluna sp.]
MGPELRLLAIVLAVLAAVALAFGAQFQNQAVSTSREKHVQPKVSLSIRELINLLIKPRWVSGTGLMFLAMLLQLGALSLAPLIVVQPIGAIALVITSVLNARYTKTKLNRATILAIGLSTFGVGGFVVTASQVAAQVKLTDENLLRVLLLFVIILVAFAALFFIFGKKAQALTYILGAGVLYGFVATLAKVTIQRLYQMDYDILTLIAVVSMIGAVLLGGWFVQNAYASGPPDLVIAGLTVIDPIVAIAIAIGILGEAQEATLGSGSFFSAFGLLAICGVYLLSKFHPELRNRAKASVK